MYGKTQIKDILYLIITSIFNNYIINRNLHDSLCISIPLVLVHCEEILVNYSIVIFINWLTQYNGLQDTFFQLGNEQYVWQCY